MPVRQPIVTVMGHVDHGKTTILDSIRGSYVAAGESGGITQGIGATEVPIERVARLCADIRGGMQFTIPGLLFIDTPGHHAFVSMRARGSALSDIAVVVIDIREGVMPQTVESIKLLRRFRTPFVIAANKIDLIEGWRSGSFESFISLLQKQREEAIERLDSALYKIVGDLSSLGFSSERYDRIKDFTRNVAIVPLSAKTKDGIPDLLLVLTGLAQRYLEQRLDSEDGPAQGTIIEVKDEKGFGTTADTIIYSGTLRVGDRVAIGVKNGVKTTRIRGIFKARPLGETKDPKERFAPFQSVSAAAGIKLLLQDTEDINAGAPIYVYRDDPSEVAEKIRRESEVGVSFDETGVLIRTDAIGSLEALLLEARDREIRIERGETGPVTRRDIIERSSKTDPLDRAILAFNVPVLPEAAEELTNADVKVISGDVIYSILDNFTKWRDQKKEELMNRKRKEMVFPAKLLILPNHVFRLSKPAIVGVRVLAGQITQGTGLIRADGREAGKLRSIRAGEQPKTVAVAGEEVAIAIEGPTVGRQISEGDILYSDMPEEDARKITPEELTFDEAQILDEIRNIKRKSDPFWGN
ncbi:MAG: translation initiation factor IF-2 [Thermoplasmata archaeon]|uniref:Probable translation initiation factor IF-2 n=1 Tax=Candidatus Sysuiplasma superficiale TaxID=2823368 RepID=A0A8J7YPX8_9ARCH|nr:translation initiation factor IF-2 [Candidatus Sysuiplasma superficiale]MBX8643969.1 translation initiation factor IF-2 [Candidatus Sysuiplasma superficiale]MCL4346896.1 translation initiation factor IF-2 [Candidatus Thermoplasmatota archaeon]